MVNSLRFLCLIFPFLLLIHCRNNKVEQEIQFSIQNTEAIGRISLYSKVYGHQEIIRRNNRWWINDSTKARADAVENILKILPTIKVKYYPPKSAWEYMIHTVQQEGVKVSFMDVDHHQIKSMYIGGTTNDERGTYAMIDGSTQPYVIQSAGFDGNLGTRFKISNEEWRDRMIIDELYTDIEYVQLDYDQKPALGFRIEQSSENNYKVYDESKHDIKSSLPLVKTYLQSLNKIGCEGIENDFVNKGLVLASTPYATLTLKIKNKSSRTIKIYTMESVGEESLERMFVYDGHDFYLAQLRILQKLFRPIDYFKVK